MMKQTQVIWLFMLVILFPLLYSCAGKQQVTIIVPPQSITAQKNSSDWTATPIDSVVKDSLIVHAKGPNDVLRLKFVSLRSNRDSVLSSQDYYYTTNAAGAIVNRFVVDTSAQNSISVLNNATTNTVNGQFSIRFKIYSSTTNVDTGAVTFTNGKFTLRIH